MKAQLKTNQMNHLLNQELSETNALLDKFVYSCSHDLKGPLASIKGLIKLAESSVQSKDTEEYLKLINESVYRMGHFVKSLESYVTCARGPVAKADIEFIEIINRIIEEQLKYTKNGRVKLKVRINQLERFNSDKERIALILDHLLQNAFNFQDLRKAEPFIDIDIKVDHRQATIEICDNGEGISRDNINNIFQMFYRSSEYSKGSGLGLYIAQGATQKLGGGITVASSKGVGSNFTVTIPNQVKR